MLLVYAIVPSDSVLPEAMEGCVIAAAGPVGAVYESIEQPPRSDAEALLRYAETIRMIGRNARLLPVRYGTVLPSVEELERLLDERGSSWKKQLDEVGGCEELIVHIAGDSIPEPAAAGSVSGTGYLMSRVRRHRHIDALVNGLSAALGTSARRSTVLSSSGDLRVAFLVGPGAAPAFREAIDRWGDSLPGLHIQVTGPWPPFSFAAGMEDSR